uniref:Uncharacterized protein n=1 Tax=Cairina moschata TaxID=8855 RepID=A0A8C3BX57_CAIMO
RRRCGRRASGAQNSWAQAIRRAQPPEQLGLQACATAPGHRCPAPALLHSSCR